MKNDDFTKLLSGVGHWSEEHEQNQSVGDKVADSIATFIGSWTFVIIQTVIMFLWVVYNTTMVWKWMHGIQFDPFPFVFLNLFMSAEAAYSTPLILMSQNRAAERDRLHADHDFEVNRRALALLLHICTHFDIRFDEIEAEIEEL